MSAKEILSTVLGVSVPTAIVSMIVMYLGWYFFLREKENKGSSQHTDIPVMNIIISIVFALSTTIAIVSYTGISNGEPTVKFTAEECDIEQMAKDLDLSPVERAYEDEDESSVILRDKIFGKVYYVYLVPNEKRTVEKLAKLKDKQDYMALYEKYKKSE